MFQEPGLEAWRLSWRFPFHLSFRARPRPSGRVEEPDGSCFLLIDKQLQWQVRRLIPLDRDSLGMTGQEIVPL
jgi:hypothetical protein